MTEQKEQDVVFVEDPLLEAMLDGVDREIKRILRRYIKKVPGLSFDFRIQAFYDYEVDDSELVEAMREELDMVKTELEAEKNKECI